MGFQKKMIIDEKKLVKEYVMDMDFVFDLEYIWMSGVKVWNWVCEQ